MSGVSNRNFEILRDHFNMRTERTARIPQRVYDQLTPEQRAQLRFPPSPELTMLDVPTHRLTLQEWRRRPAWFQIVHDMLFPAPRRSARLAGGAQLEEFNPNPDIEHPRAGAAPGNISVEAARMIFPQALSSVEYFRLNAAQKRRYNLLRGLLGYPAPRGGNVEISVYRKHDDPPDAGMEIFSRRDMPDRFDGELRKLRGPVNRCIEIDETEPGIPIVWGFRFDDIGYKRNINGAIEIRGHVVNNMLDHLINWELTYATILPQYREMLNGLVPFTTDAPDSYHMQVRIGVYAEEIDGGRRVLYNAFRWRVLNTVDANMKGNIHDWCFDIMQNYSITNLRVFSLGVHLINAAGIGLGKSWAAIQDKYALISFRSRGQCVLRTFCFLDALYKNDPRLYANFSWTAVSAFLGPRVQETLVRLKREYPDHEWKMVDRISKIGIRGMNWEMIEMVARAFDVHLVVYNNVFQITKDINEGGARTFETMVLDSHMVAAIPLSKARRNDQLMSFLKYSTFETLKTGDVATTIGRHLEKIQAQEDLFEEDTIFKHPRIDYPKTEASVNYVNKKYYYGAYDFETYVNPYSQELVPYVGMVYTQTPGTPVTVLQYQRFCVSDIFAILHDELIPHCLTLKEKETLDICLFAHNAARFDAYLVLTDAIRDDPDTDWNINGNSTFVVMNGAIVCMELVSKSDPRLVVRLLDTYRHIPVKLEKMCKDLKVKHQKLKDAFAHPDVDDAFIDDPANLQTIIKYLRHDVMGLYESVVTYADSIWNSFSVCLGQCLTAASLSKSIFLQNYYDPKKYPLYNLPKRKDRLLRPLYIGGRCECGVQGHWNGPIYDYDFTSVYPNVGCQNLPYGKMKIIKKCPYLNHMLREREFWGFLKVNVRSIPGCTKRPLHGARIDGKLVFPEFTDWCTIGLWCEEYYAGLDLHGGYEYEVLEAYQFDKGPVMREFFQDMFKRKKEAKQQGNGGLMLGAKVIANSGYGWTAFRSEGKRTIEIHDEKANMPAVYMVRGQLIDYCPFREDLVMVSVEKELEVNNYNVSIGAAITSKARIKLWQLISAIDATGKIVFYWDTDSVFTNLDFAEYPDLAKEFMPDYINNDARTAGIELGSLKSECNDLFPNSTKFESFDEGIFLLPKLYLLRKKMPDGSYEYKGGSKGFSKAATVKLIDDQVFKENKHVGSIKEGQIVDLEGNKLVYNEFLVNEQDQELDRKTFAVKEDEFGNPYYRGPPAWDDYLELCNGKRLTRHMDRLAAPFKNAMTEDSRSLLEKSTMMRTTTVFTEDGRNRYSKGNVLDSRIIAPLRIPEQSVFSSDEGPLNLMGNPYDLASKQIESLRRQRENWILATEAEIDELDELMTTATSVAAAAGRAVRI